MEAAEPDADPTTVVVTLCGELDASDSAWSEAVQTAIDDGVRRMVIDLLNVSFVDSSVIQALLVARRRVAGDGWLRLVYTHHLVGRVIDICGLTEVFPQYTTVDAALRGAPTRAAAARSAGLEEEEDT